MLHLLPCSLIKTDVASTKTIREGLKKWKFEMAFAIRRRTPPAPSKWHKFPSIFLSHFFSVAIESYIYETDFTLDLSQKYHS